MRTYAVKFERHIHKDKVVASWVDTARQLWKEFACETCGRLRRKRV